MTFEAALDFANRLYLSNRRDFHPPRTREGVDLKVVEKNRRTAFFDDLHAKRMWERRHT